MESDPDTAKAEPPCTRARVDGHAGSIPAAPSAPAPINPFNGRPFSDRYKKILNVRQHLPVYEKREIIQRTVLSSPVTLLVGETGSGKTTQVPHFLAELQTSFPGLVACTQPRRIAAVSVANRVAEEMDVVLGEEVGYHVRFQSAMSSRTKVLYLTDGMLLREAYSDPDLLKYSVVVVDEAHERTIDTDVVLGLLKQLTARRPSFRLVVMSATLDIAKIQSFFPGAPLLQVSGRMYNVEVFYTPRPVTDYVAAAVQCILALHDREPPGDILCFLTGEAEIEKAVATTAAALRRAVEVRGAERNSPPSLSADTKLETSVGPPPPSAVVLPLYGSLSLLDQQKVFCDYPSDTRKIVFTTNIAETSVTIDGIVYVVDCGYQKQNLYNSQARVDYLLPALISKASAEQRKGRAGRTRLGKCYRMFTLEDYAAFPDQSHPEVLRTNIMNTVLFLLKLGVSNPCHFPFIDAPSDQSMEDAFYQLLYFQAVDDQLQLTDFGRKLADFPVDACLARMLLKASKHGCAADAAVVAAMLEAGNLFTRPPSRAQEADQVRAQTGHPDGDHVSLFFLFHEYYRNQAQGATFCRTNFLRHQAFQQAVQVYTQLRRIMTQHQVEVTSTYNAKEGTVNTVALRKAVLEGFFTQVAFLPPGSVYYRTARDALQVSLHRQSVLSSKSRRRPQWIVYDRLEVQGAEGTFARTASAVEVEWLLDVSEFFSDPAEIGDTEIALVLKRASEAYKYLQKV